MASAAATLSQTFERQADKYGARVFLRDKRQKEWRDHSWREIADATMRLRAGLIRFGIKPGDRVAILADNCPQWVVVDQAVLGLGAIVVPLFTTSGVEETRHVIADSGACLVAAYGDQLIKKVAGLRTSLPAVAGMLAMHPGAAADNAGEFKLMTLAGMSGGDPMPSIEGSGDDLATFIYTSGTTGAPKGAMLTHWNILSNCDANA
ncbi:MAG: AMP-binding protein, partial [Pseudomonadota bacterium]